MSKAEEYNARQEAQGAYDSISSGPLFDLLKIHPPSSEAFSQGVKSLQRAHGRLVVDGYAGPLTIGAYMEAEPTPEPEQGSGDREGVKVSLYYGWGRLSDIHLQELKEAGCHEIILNLNDASARGKWRWSPSQARVHKSIDRLSALGFDLCLMPWTWCRRAFMDRACQEMEELLKRSPAIKRLELDCEGSWEVSAKSEARKRGSIGKAVDHALIPWLELLEKHSSQGRDLIPSSTTLYFLRPAGTYLMKHYMEEVSVQAYSVWLQTGTKKDPATHKPNFAPGVLQERAYKYHLPILKASPKIKTFSMALAAWSQDRSKAPPMLQMSKSEAMRRASSMALSYGANVSYWAGHLVDGKGRREREYWKLMIDEIKYLTRGGGD